MTKIKELREKRASLEAQVAEHLRSVEGRSMTTEEVTKFDNLEKDFNAVDTELRVEERREAWNRKQVESQADGEQTDQEMERKIFRKTLQSCKMEPNYTAEERAYIDKRAAVTGIKTDENFVPKEMANFIEVAMKSVSGMMEAGSIITTERGGELVLPTVNDVAAKSTILAELETVAEAAKTFGSIKMGAFTYGTPAILLSYEALQDAVVDLEPLVSRLLGEAHGRGVNEHLTLGTGVNQPKGIVTAAVQGASAATDAIKFDDLLDLMASVDPAYANAGRFMFNNHTLYALMKVKDNNGQYIWQPATTAGAPAMIFGKPYVLNTDMPDIGAGNASVLFGALSKYQIRMVRNFSIQVLREKYATSRAIGILGYARLDGNLIDAGTNPVKKLVHA